jgi:hypothetical protein
VRNEQEWNIRKNIREGFSILLFVVLLYSLTNIPGDSASFVEQLTNRQTQSQFLFTIFSFIFCLSLISKRFKIWIFWLGISVLPVGIGLILGRLDALLLNLDSANSPEYTTWFLAGLVSVILIVFINVMMFVKQSITFQSNSPAERASAVLGVLFASLMLLGEYLPWSRSIYTSTNANWTFKGSGTQRYVEECCYMSDYSFLYASGIVLPIVGLFVFFIFRILGYQVPNLTFISILAWGILSGIRYLGDTGIQDPTSVSNWTAEQISSNGLTYKIEAMLGGYLFIFSLLGVAITLLVPRVIYGRNVIRENAQVKTNGEGK